MLDLRLEEIIYILILVAYLIQLVDRLLLNKCVFFLIKDIFTILSQDFALTLLNYHERYYESENVREFLQVSEELICPLISIFGQEYSLNGIDIIESFAKFQEAVFCAIVDNKPFHKTIDISGLNREYYSAFAYFQEQMGSDRIVEFPIICEMALSSNKLCKFDSNDLSWRDNHPAWRFVKIIDIIKGKRHTLPTVGKDIKLKYPWFLSFPFLDTRIFKSSGINDLQQYYLIFNDTSRYFIDDESKISEIIFESHFQAFPNQILGNMSRRCIYPDLLQCGFSYYGLSGCKYLKEGTCIGHFDQNSRIEELKFDENGNVTQGCLFECFLQAADIDPDSISFSRIGDKANFQDLKKRIQELITLYLAMK